jgi:peptidoglycan/LPS O-acetylase OafA/YrhL
VIRNPQWLATWSVAARVALGFAAIIAAALMLWYFFERPARRWLLDRQPSRWSRTSDVRSCGLRLPPRT